MIGSKSIFQVEISLSFTIRIQWPQKDNESGLQELGWTSFNRSSLRTTSSKEKSRRKDPHLAKFAYANYPFLKSQLFLYIELFLSSGSGFGISFLSSLMQAALQAERMRIGMEMDDRLKWRSPFHIISSNMWKGHWYYSCSPFLFFSFPFFSSLRFCISLFYLSFSKCVNRLHFYSANLDFCALRIKNFGWLKLNLVCFARARVGSRDPSWPSCLHDVLNAMFLVPACLLACM